MKQKNRQFIYYMLHFLDLFDHGTSPWSFSIMELILRASEETGILKNASRKFWFIPIEMREERHIYNYYTMTKNAQVVYILALKYSQSLTWWWHAVYMCLYTHTDTHTLWARGMSPLLRAQDSPLRLQSQV